MPEEPLPTPADPGTAAWSRTNFRPLALAMLVTLIGMFIFEALKQFAFPQLTLWQSHGLTILFSTALAGGAGSVMLRNFQTLLRARSERERQSEERLAEIAAVNEALRASRERFRRTMLDAPFPIMVHAEDGEVIDLNHAWTALTGYAREDIPTINDWTRKACGREHQHIQAYIKQLYAREGPREEGEYRVTTARGEQRVWDFSTAPLGRLPDGRRLVISMAKDSTSRHEIEERLRATEERFRRIAAHSPGTVYQFLRRPDNSDAFPFISDGCRELYGLEPQAIEQDADTLLSLIHPADRPAFNASVEHSARTLLPWTWEGRFVLASGKTKWVKAAARPERQANGDVLWDGQALDDTEQKNTQALLRQAKEVAERANASKSEFLSRMSHELRTPMNAILGFGQLLELGDLDGPQRECVEHILNGGRHLLDLINEVLDLSRIESGQLSVLPQSVSIRDALSDAAEFVRPLAVQQDVRLQVDLPDEGGGTCVWADPQRLRQILLNLMANAVKYNRPHGQVTLECQRRGSPADRAARVRLNVRDTGPGIAPDLLERLFTPFERLGAERTGIEGTGLGLALCKRLAEIMDGEMGVESVPGQGSTFWLELPLAASNPVMDDLPAADPPPAAADPRVAPPPAPAAAEAAEAVVLYVEDDPSNLELVERLLQRRGGIRLLSAGSGPQALAIAREQPLDLILLDLHLPDLSGEEILHALRAGPPTRGVPVVVVSADATAWRIERLRAAGAHAYLTKPLDLPSFYATLDQVFRREKT